MFPDRLRTALLLLVVHCTDRNGNRNTGIFLWKTQSTDDENRIKYAWMSFSRSSNGWGPYGYRCDFRNGKWYVYCIGSLWMFNEGHTQNLCLSSDNGIEWSGRYRQYSKSKREIVFDNWKTSCISTSFPYHGNRTGNFTSFL